MIRTEIHSRDLTFTVPDLPRSVGGLIVPIQLVIDGPQGITLENGGTMVWLDATL